MTDDYLMSLTPEEVRRIARQIADIIVETPQYYDTVGIVEAIEEIDLTSMITSVGGLMDPLGQLKGFITDTLNSIASWIADTVLAGVDRFIGTLRDKIWGWISGVLDTLSKAVEGIKSWIEERIKEVSKAISSAIEGIVKTITDIISRLQENIAKVLGDITKAISGLREAFEKVVVKPIMDAIAQAQRFMGQLPSIIEGIAGKISGAVSGVISGIGKLFDSVRAGVMDLLGRIQGALKPIFDTIGKIGATITKLIQDTSKTFTEWIGNVGRAFQDVYKVITEGIKTISGFFAGIVKQAQDFIAWLSEGIGNVQKMFMDFVDMLAKAPEKIPEVVMSVATAVWEKVVKPVWEWVYEHVIKPTQEWIGNIVKQVQQGFAIIGKTFEGFVNAVLRLPEMLWNLLPDWLRKAIIAIQKAIDAFVSGLEEFLKDPIGKIKETFSWLAQQVWEMLPDWLKSAITSFQKAIESFVSGLQKFLEDPIGTIKGAFSWLAEQIWKLLPEWVKETITSIQKAIEAFVSGLQEFLKDPIGKIKEGFSWLAQQMWEMLPDFIKEWITRMNEIISKIRESIIKLGEEFYAFISDPLGYVKRIGEMIFRGISWALEQVSGFIISAIKTIISFAIRAFTTLIDATSQAVRPLIEWVKDMTFKTIEVTLPLQSEAWDEVIKATVKPTETKLGEGWAFYTVTGPVIGQYIVSLNLPLAVEGLSKSIKHTEGGGEAGAGGIGIIGKLFSRIRADWMATLKSLGRHMWGLFKEVGRHVLWPVTFWFFEWFRYLIRIFWMKRFEAHGAIYYCFEIPPFSTLINLAQRYYPTEFAETIIDAVKESLFARGYPLWFYNYVTKPVLEVYTSTIEKLPDDIKKRIVKKYIVTVKDRFDKDRGLPASPFFDIPTASEMCRMMVRDIFKSVDDFTLAMLMRGFVPDIAYMFYLLHFRYPPPRMLWRFISRGMAGLLWFEPKKLMTKEALDEIKHEIQRIGAYEPKAPTELNFKVKELITGLITYMKWHDYARFAWMPGFTSDNWMVIDALADLPTRWDIRWMMKWGVFDHIASKEVKLKSPVSEFYKVIEDKPANEKVMMDITLACRLFLARGLHPYYAPIVAAADVINALVDERTLLRTGLINLYEYGMMDQQTLDGLMANLVTATYKVAYVDLTTGEWKEGYINMPIMYLPAERKLLELRGLIDRYHRIFRDVLSDVHTAYREYIIDENKAKNILEDAIDTINEVFKTEVEAIVGREIGLSIDENYVKTLLKTMYLERDIWTTRRIRSWFSRILGWIIYRMAYGYVTEEDVKQVINKAKEVAKLTEAEALALTEIMTLLSGVAVREYIPTPMTLASIVEIVPEARRMLADVLRARRIPEDWRTIWSKYVAVRPVIDEVRRILTSAERLYEYFMIDEEMYKKLLDVLKEYGWEDYEIKLILDWSNLERWHRAYRELIGTPRELVTMAEYSPRARQLALAEVKKMIDALPIDDKTKEFLKTMWEEYIRIRPVYDEVRREVTELISDYAEGIITWEQFVNFLEELKKWGLDDYEIDAYKFIATMRRRRYLARRGIS